MPVGASAACGHVPPAVPFQGPGPGARCWLRGREGFLRLGPVTCLGDCRSPDIRSEPRSSPRARCPSQVTTASERTRQVLCSGKQRNVEVPTLVLADTLAGYSPTRRGPGAKCLPPSSGVSRLLCGDALCSNLLPRWRNGLRRHSQEGKVGLTPPIMIAP